MMYSYYDRSSFEMEWVMQWARLWKRANPGKQYSWAACLRSLRTDPAVVGKFQPQHMEKELLREAHRRAIIDTPAVVAVV